MKKGYYIVFEGGEGSGKSTQAKLLYEYLTEKNISCILTKEPGGTKEGQKIRQILIDKESVLSPFSELFLFLADRVESYHKIIKPNLEQGKIIIKDRSRFSTEAHQGAAGKIDMEIIRKLNKISTFNINPDLLIIIDINSEEGLKKEEDSNRFAAKGLEYHQKVNQFYRKLAEKLDFAVLIKYEEGNPQAMHKEILKHLKERLKI
jgi:dTMP kinase